MVDAGGELVRTEDIDIPRATMMHDFGVTATRVVFLDLPVLFDLDLAASRAVAPLPLGARGGRPGRGAAPQRGRRRHPLDRHRPGYVFHVLNAYDDGDTVVMDVIRYDRAFDTDPGGPIASGLPVLARWTVDPAADRVGEQRLDDVPVEFPRIDDVVAGLPHRYGYCIRLGDRPTSPPQTG